MQSENDFMQLAIRLATENVRSGVGGPFGAVVVRNGEIVATGVNRVTAENDPTAHAEVNAIREACKALGTFQVTWLRTLQQLRTCPMCLGAIYWVRLDSVYFGNTCHDAAEVGFDDHFIYEELAVPRDQRKLPTVRLLPEQAIESFRAWQEHQSKSLISWENRWIAATLPQSFCPDSGRNSRRAAKTQNDAGFSRR